MRYLALVLLTACQMSFDTTGLSELDQTNFEEAVAAYENLGCNFSNFSGGTISVGFRDVGKWQAEYQPGSAFKDGYIALNSKLNWYHSYGPCDGIDVQSAFMHELGHVIGLQHSPETQDVMYQALRNCEFKRRFSVEEEKKIREICN